MRSILERNRNEVKCTSDFSSLLNEDLSKYHVIIPIWSCGIKGDMYLNALLKAIESGVGFATFHGGINWFEENRYYEMIGGFYLRDTQYEHAHILLKNDHPIIRGHHDFCYSGEVFDVMYDTDNILLAELQTSENKRPYAWVKNFGKGRVFYTMGAHDLGSLLDGPCRELILNGIEWCAGAVRQ